MKKPDCARLSLIRKPIDFHYDCQLDQLGYQTSWVVGLPNLMAVGLPNLIGGGLVEGLVVGVVARLGNSAVFIGQWYEVC